MQHTFSIWAEGRSLDAHVAYQNEQLQRATNEVLEYVGLVDEMGKLAASSKRFALSMRNGDEVVPTVGIGAVMVPEILRRRGVGQKLVESVLDEARLAGVRLAWLFSEIDPTYYARFGFRQVEWPIFATEVSALPDGSELELRSSGSSFSTDEIREAERLESARFGARPKMLRPLRDCAVRTYFSWRNEIETVWLQRRDGRVAGYVALRRRAAQSETGHSPLSVLEVADWAWTGLDDDERFAALRKLAEARGATHVAGPLGEDGTSDRFARFESDSHGAPMVAVLDSNLELPVGTGGKVSANQMHFGLCDYF